MDQEIEQTQVGASVASPLARLTEQDRRLLSLVAAGLTSKEIARILDRTPGSIDTSLKRAGRRAGIADRRELARTVSEQYPEVLQWALQRLEHLRNSLEAEDQPPPTQVVATADFMPERRWRDLPKWQKRLWAIAIAVGTLATAALLVALSSHVLRGLATL